MALLKNCFLKVIILSGFALVFSTMVAAKETRPKYKVENIKISNHVVKVEVAATEEEHAFGLMYVTHLQKNSGMLFVFSNDQVRNFWMKNTLIPLSIGFFDKNKTLISIHEMQPYIEGSGAPAIYSSAGPARFALEMNKNWFALNKVKIGEKFHFVK